jgi:nucleoside-triphosphatase THEP1
LPESDSLRLLGVCFAPGTPVDETLSDVAERLRAKGLTIAGHVQVRGKDPGDCGCNNMQLRDLATGKYLKISESLGPGSSGCQLDPQALIGAAQALEAALSEATDVLIINRFGRSEAEGRGLRAAIEKAMFLGVSVIIAYREDYADAWEAFHGGLAVACDPAIEEILAACGRAA